jgi:CHAT domain-containing protein/Tfp pilus assembly protein PilF
VTKADEQNKLSAEILARLSEITDTGKRKEFLRRHKLFRASVVPELNAETQREFRVNTNRAQALAETAVLIARQIRKDELLAPSYRMLGNVTTAAGDYQAAIPEYEEALELFERLRDDEGVARTLTAVIQPHIMLGNYDRAFAAANRAQKLFVQLKDERRLARLENNIGNIFHRQDRFDEALEHYEHAYRRLLPYDDSEELIISLNNMSMCLISMNDFAQALATYNRAKELLANKDLPLIHLITDYNIAYLYYLRGDYRRAIEMLKSARIAGEKIDYSYLVALCLLDLSDIYVELNLSAEAQEVAEQGYQLFRNLEIGYEAAKTLANQAIALGQEGKTRKSLELFAEARPLFVQEKNEVWPWLVDLYQAMVLFHQGRHYEAKRLALGAAEFFDGSFLKSKAALCHLLLAQVEMKTGEAENAFAECNRALKQLEQLDSPMLRYQGRFLLGQVEHGRGEISAAYAAYQQARSELESLRSSLGRDELKISFMRNRSELYERLVELCIGGELEGASNEEAFGYVELAKSRSLTEIMFQRNHALQEAKPGQSELVHKIRDLREELNWYQHRIELEQLRPGGNAQQRIEQLHSEAQAREKQLLSVLGELPSSEATAGVLPMQGQMPLEQIRASFAKRETLVEYFFLGDRILAAVLTKESLEIVPLTTVPRIAESLRLLRFQLGKFQTPGASDTKSENVFRATLAHLEELYKELVAPIRERLMSRHVVFVPHGVLHYLPFHALYDGEAYLIDNYDISYAPSASVYALCQRRRRDSGEGSLVLGVPDERAPLIEEEVRSVHAAVPESHLYLGESADHELFFREGPRKRHIHIATHGSFRPDNPMFSGIRLGDGYLYLYELYHMRLSAELLVLSGCATGLNVVAAGDELVGLIRGALHAGARSLLLSLWDVHDESTTQFMTAFYGRWGQGEEGAGAYANAIKEVRERHPHPYYWAPFVLVGKALTGLGNETGRN